MTFRCVKCGKEIKPNVGKLCGKCLYDATQEGKAGEGTE